MTNFDILRQEFLNKLNETGSVRSPELQLDGISEDYMDFMNQVSIEKYSIPCDEVGRAGNLLCNSGKRVLEISVLCSSIFMEVDTFIPQMKKT